jgi:glycosyltransferase involved in cell wall biosynthesis
MLARQVALAFAKRGVEVTVFYAAVEECPELGPYGLRRHAEGGVQLIGLCNRPSAFLDMARPDREIEDPLVAHAFGRILDEVRPDVVHFFNLHNLGLALPGQCSGRGIPTVLSSNNYWSVCPRLYLMRADGQLCDGAAGGAQRCADCCEQMGAADLYRLRHDAAQRCLNEELDLHLSVSVRMKEIFVANGMRPDRVHVLQQQPESLDAIWQQVGARRAIVPELQRPLRVAFIGSLLPHKGPQVLVQALQALPRGSVDLQLHGDGDRSFGEYLLSLDPTGSVRFGGRYGLDELPARLALADVVVVPSLWEDCAPYVVAEALAARAPVLGSRMGGIPDFIEEGRSGFLFGLGDARELASLIGAFLADRTLLGRMQAAIQAPRGFGAYLDDLWSSYEGLGARSTSSSDAPETSIARA